MIYKLILAIRNRRYRSGKHSTSADVPTLVFGNITVGGTGKTPHVELAVRRLLTLGRSDIALLSLGYGRKTKGFRYVTTQDTPDLCGDEPLQLKRKFPILPVAVAKDRVDACNRLAHAEEDPAGIIILDDAFQYRRLQPSKCVVLTPFLRPVTTDKLLPCGRLRDLKKRLYDAQAIIVTKCPYELDDLEKREHAELLGFQDYDPQTCTCTRNGVIYTLLFSRIVHCNPEPVFQDADRRYTYAERVILFSGIADDTPLRDHLSDSRMIMAHIRFPDHHRYRRADVRRLRRLMRKNPTSVFITTEKDAMRLKTLSNVPAALQSRLFYVPIQAAFLSPQEEEAFDKLLLQL